VKDLSEKRKQKSIWVPKKWLDWTTKYYNDNKAELNSLGIDSPEDLVWRLAQMGQPELDDLVKHVRNRKEKPS
jgi:hypothetical protein